MRLFCCISLAVFGFASASTDRASPVPDKKSKPKESARPVIRDYTKRSGVVKQLGPGWLELDAGWSAPRTEGKPPDYDNSKPVRLSAVGTTPGGDLGGVGRECTHRLADLRPKDYVSIEAGLTKEGQLYCLEITIIRRPGGTIPRWSGERFREHPAERHFQNQAEQDWEEKGIPIPKLYLDPQGRAPWTNPPYPPVAPQPRPAPAKP